MVAVTIMRQIIPKFISTDALVYTHQIVLPISTKFKFKNKNIVNEYSTVKRDLIFKL